MSHLGVRCDGATTRFTVFSAHAEAVTLCLFDDPASGVARETHALVRGDDDVWRTELEGLPAGQLYGYRAEGPWEPQRGHRFNPSKLLVDPMAPAITGEPRLHPSLFSYQPGAEGHEEYAYNGEESAAYVPKCVAVDGAFDWQGVEPPATPWRDTVIYEGHVRGMSRLHPEIDERLRGTYLGLVAPPVLEHLVHLGITAVELLPVQHVASEPQLLRRGLRNYWGYSPLGFCAPFSGYATGHLGEQVDEFKTMVRELHRAGLEVILDVVFNHDAEGDHLGPALSLKGLDNRTYFRLHRWKQARYVNYTGCGNTLDAGRPAVRRMILESLRYWVREMRVDGFRFDLATVLGRDGPKGAFDSSAPLFQSVSEDPDLSRVKLIAEPWDVGPEGHRLGRFPRPFREWNDRYRDAVRGFWRGGPGAIGDLAARLAGSRDAFADKGPLASVNYVACHDGFTLADVVSYERKHNEANGEDNHDGHPDDLSRNWGHEGPTENPGVRAARDRARRNLLATLALSQGVPMLLHGDEIGRSQGGNNNAYCQDNEVSWVDWPRADHGLSEYVRHLLAIRRRFPVLRSERYLDELRWWHPEGRELASAEWKDAGQRAVAVLLPSEDSEGDLLLLVNGGDSQLRFRLPADREWESLRWTELLDTSHGRPEESPLDGPPALELEPFTLRLYSLEAALSSS